MPMRGLELLNRASCKLDHLHTSREGEQHITTSSTIEALESWICMKEEC